jgi:4-hydroxy-tetrahydrodipicolinate reductase
MKIALLGYGKMGKAIEVLAQQRGHSIGVTIDNETEWSEKEDVLKSCDVAIDFSMPSTAVGNIRRCLSMGLPIVVGTTGWYDLLDSVVTECKQKDGALFVASNFSIGMNIMFDLNRRLAQMMNRYPDYDVSISEIHHIHKLDAPSGTAITLAKDVAERLDRKSDWQLLSVTRTDPETGCKTVENAETKRDNHKVAITSERLGEEAGTHEVVYDSAVDTLSIRHSAKNRQGLALGAVLAAEFMSGKKGYYTMQDLLRA